MASSPSSTFLLATTMLALLCHTGADPVADAQTKADQALSAIKEATDLAEKYMAGGDAKANACADSFDDAEELMNKCVESLKTFKKESISDLQTWGSGALTGVTTCDDEFPSQPDDLKKASSNAKEFVVSFLKVVNAL